MQTSGTIILSKQPRKPTAREAAERAAEALFTSGAGEKAEHLILDLAGHRNGGGWCQFAARDVIERAIKGEP